MALLVERIDQRFQSAAVQDTRSKKAQFEYALFSTPHLAKRGTADNVASFVREQIGKGQGGHVIVCCTTDSARPGDLPQSGILDYFTDPSEYHSAISTVLLVSARKFQRLAKFTT